MKRKEYRVVGARIDRFSQSDSAPAPGVREQLVLLSDDGVKGILNNPPATVQGLVDKAVYSSRDVSFQLRNYQEGSEISALTIEGERFLF